MGKWLKSMAKVGAVLLTWDFFIRIYFGFLPDKNINYLVFSIIIFLVGAVPLWYFGFRKEPSSYSPI